MGFHKDTIGGPSPDLLEQEVVFCGTGTASYNAECAKCLCTISGWSYSDLPTFKEKIANSFPDLRRSNFLQVSVTNDPMLVVASAQIIRTSDRKKVIVSFRGTELVNLVNWLTDAGTKKVAYKNLHVHSGFLRNFGEVWYGQRGILEHLKRPFKLHKGFNRYDTDTTKIDDPASEQNDLEEIYITGHSLGGAMAQLAGLSLYADPLWNKVKGIYTYGQPMVVSVEDRNTCEKQIGNALFRHVYYNDIVPHLPPLSTGAFDHAGLEYKYKPCDREWKLRDGTARATQIFSILLAAPFAFADAIVQNIQWFSFLKMPWSFSDHSPNEYITAFQGVQ